MSEETSQKAKLFFKKQFVSKIVYNLGDKILAKLCLVQDMINRQNSPAWETKHRQLMCIINKNSFVRRCVAERLLKRIPRKL